MTRSSTLLIVIVVAALALPPSASLAQQRGRQQIPPGGPIFPTGRVLGGEPPNLVILSLSSSPLKCVGPSIGQVTISVQVQNKGKGAAVMPTTMPTLGRSWVGVWDLHKLPPVMAIAAGPPPLLNPGETKVFGVPVIVLPRSEPTGVGYSIGALVDPQNLILEFNENDNISSRFFGSFTLCQ
jgi:hypothetical protein